MCRKAGKLELGFDAAKESVQSGKARLVLTADGMSPKTLKEIAFHCDKSSVPIRGISFTPQDMSQYFRKAVGIFSISDDGFAKKITEITDESKA